MTGRGLMLLGLWLAGIHSGRGEGWPAYMHDNARSGVTTNAVTLPLSEIWCYEAPAAPKPAWPEPQDGWTELPKLKFDDALFVVADDGRVVFGSSVDNQVHALDAATGRTLWTFFTGAPVRLAPALSQGRVYAASDDGWLYCLKASDGSLVWKFNGAPRSETMLGSGRVTSLWPARTGVLVQDDVVYFSAGIFPWHQVRLYALKAGSGEVIWVQNGVQKKEDKKKIEMPRGGWAPQGHLLATDSLLVTLNGRAWPFLWKLTDGAFVPSNFSASDKGQATGVYGILVSNLLVVGSQDILFGIGLKADVKPSKFKEARRLVAANDVLYLLNGDVPGAYGRQGDPTTRTLRAVSRSGQDKKPLWTYKRAGLDALIVAGAQVIVGGTHEVLALDAATGKELWVGAVKGRAAELAVAEGRLLVSTDQGVVHCFGKGAPAAKAPAEKVSWPATPGMGEAAKAAGELLKATGAKRGYAIVAGPGSDALACELARQSELNVYVYEPDETKAREARQRVDAAGLYGWRVTVSGGATNTLPFPDYMANLVVCAGARGKTTPEEWLRVLRPCGGVLLAGGWGPEAAESDLKVWAPAGTLSRGVRLGEAAWAKLVRGELEGSGWWTHQYADAGNSGSSGDKRVTGTLQVLWHGEPGADKFPDRHRRGSAPLVLNGRVFSQAFEFPGRKNLVLSFDAYNGTPYWEREVPRALRLEFPNVPGNLACSTDGVFVAAASACHRLDIETGETRTVYETPKSADGRAPAWGYVSVAGGRLFGSALKGTNVMFSSSVFAYDLGSGRELWRYSAKEIRDTTIAVGQGRLFFLENRQTNEAPAAPAVDKDELGEAGSDSADDDRPGKGKEAPAKSPFSTPVMRTLVAVDAETGKKIFEQTLDVKSLGRWGRGFGSIQMLCANGQLFVGGAYTPYGRPKPDEPFRQVMALSAQDGSLLWTQTVANVARPLVMGNWLLAPPGAYDWKTGVRAMRHSDKANRDYPVSMGRYPGCGQVSASASMVFYRGGYTLYKDLVKGAAGAFVGVRPGCFINVVPAGGVVVQTEAGSGCACYQALQSSFGFKPVTREKREED